MHSSYYRGCWHELSPCFLRGSVKYRRLLPYTSSPPTAVYNPKTFIPHAASLGQACAHCRRFSTAATRRCLASVSVPVVGAMLSHPLAIVALVSHYLTNKLIASQPLLRWNLTFADKPQSPARSSGITHSFPWLSPSGGYVTEMILPRSPVSPLRVLPRLACLIHAANVHSEPG